MKPDMHTSESVCALDLNECFDEECELCKLYQEYVHDTDTFLKD